jgi:hypothetical protein
MHTCQHGSTILTRHRHITGISVYFDYMIVADIIDSQKSEDRDITDKLL